MLTGFSYKLNDEDTFLTDSTFASGTTDRYLNLSCSFSSRPNEEENTLVISSVTHALDHVDTKQTLLIRPSFARVPLALPHGIGMIELSSSASGCCC